jgi:hypothetical protein
LVETNDIFLSQGGAKTHCSVSGVAHKAFDNDVEALRQLRELVDFLPGSNKEQPPRRCVAVLVIIGKDEKFPLNSFYCWPNVFKGNTQTTVSVPFRDWEPLSLRILMCHMICAKLFARFPPSLCS